MSFFAPRRYNFPPFKILLLSVNSFCFESDAVVISVRNKWVFSKRLFYLYAMKSIWQPSFYVLILWLSVSQFSCKNPDSHTWVFDNTKLVKPLYAKGFYLHDYSDFKILTVTSPWKDAEQSFHYVLADKDANIPDSLRGLTRIQVPPEKLVVTSTTHIPSLEMLQVEDQLVGFPETDYISSPKTRKRIEEGKIKNLGANEQINSELLLSLKPDVLVGFSIDQNNKAYKNFENSGIPVIYNGDWTETTPLGRAEWIKFFGYLFGKSAQAESIFLEIEMEYALAAAKAAEAVDKPTVISGSLFKDVWYLPAGDSWQAQFFKDAGARYLWSDTPGTGSLSLSLENVLAKAHNVDYWVGTDSYRSWEALQASNPHYTKIKALQERKVYTYTTTNDTGAGNIYFELAPNRPDWVLKDLIKIFHPQLLPDYNLKFYQKLE